VLVSSALDGARNIMTTGWQTVVEFTPSLVGYVIAGNHSFDLMRKSRECVINLPTTALTETVVEVGNTTSAEIEKFDRFEFTMQKADRVTGPLIVERHANFECRLAHDAPVDKCNFFIFEVANAHLAKPPKHPETLHYKGDGVFMVSGNTISRRFRLEML
jgi:flavin reductase (DIM6/NTAB) family NADH-FMN oxidoreductase RutF